MKRRGKRVLGAGGAGVIAIAAAATVAVVNLQGATAATPSGATGFAAQNGGTTGGAGGSTVRATTGTQIHQALCGRASASTPITIEVAGTITVGNTAKVSGDSCNTAAGVIELKDVSNVTLLGVGSSAVFDQIGIHLRNSSNIILQNLNVKNVKKSGSPISNGGDAVGLESGVHNVWADHLTLEASGGESDGYDGLFDMKSGTQYVTLAYSVLKNSGRAGLVGSSDTDSGNGPITYHHNYYQNIDSRTPLLRAATAHIYDNYYEGLTKSGINPRNGGKALVQNNYFKDSQDVLGTFYTDLKGTYQTSGNILDNVKWTAADSTDFPAGPSMASTGTVTVPYTATMDAASCVPAVVKATAGFGTGLKVSDGTCTPTTTPTTPVTTTTPPVTTTTPPVTTTTPPVTSGTNLSIDAGADGSSKASGTSFGKVIDGDATTYWSPTGSTGDISVKWASAQTVGAALIRETSSKVTSWQLLDGTSGKVVASGTQAGGVNFTPISTKKLTFVIKSASGTPQIAEFETYAK
jgi:pectate lyase